MAGRSYYSFDSVTGAFPSKQTVKWSDMATGTNPDAYMEETDLIGTLEIAGEVKYYRRDLEVELKQGYKAIPTVFKHIHSKTAEDEEQNILPALKDLVEQLSINIILKSRNYAFRIFR